MLTEKLRPKTTLNQGLGTGLAEVEPGEMLVDGEPRAKPAQAGRKSEQAETVLRAQELQLGARRIELGQLDQGAVQELDAGPDDAPGGDAPGEALQGAVVQKRPADKGVGGADQFRELDFLAAGQDLQA